MAIKYTWRKVVLPVSDLLDLEKIEENVFRHSPAEPVQRLYGAGVGQAPTAARVRGARLPFLSRHFAAGRPQIPFSTRSTGPGGGSLRPACGCPARLDLHLASFQKESGLRASPKCRWCLTPRVWKMTSRSCCAIPVWSPHAPGWARASFETRSVLGRPWDQTAGAGAAGPYLVEDAGAAAGRPAPAPGAAGLCLGHVAAGYVAVASWQEHFLIGAGRQPGPCHVVSSPVPRR